MNNRMADGSGPAVGDVDAGPSLDRHVTRLLMEATFVFWGHFVARAAELGLAPTQAQALSALEPGRDSPMRELAEVLDCDPSTVTGVADRLEAHGLIERRALAGDRRVRALALTEAGVERRSRLLERLADAPPSVRGLDRGTLRGLAHALDQILAIEAASGDDR